MAPASYLKKKKIAATVAVMTHLARLQAAAEAAAQQAAEPVDSNPAWSLSGRQESMMYRAMWQRRMTKSW